MHPIFILFQTPDYCGVDPCYRVAYRLIALFLAVPDPMRSPLLMPLKFVSLIRPCLPTMFTKFLRGRLETAVVFWLATTCDRPFVTKVIKNQIGHVLKVGLSGHQVN